MRKRKKLKEQKNIENINNIHAYIYIYVYSLPKLETEAKGFIEWFVGV